jgi:hypothetical protein
MGQSSYVNEREPKIMIFVDILFRYLVLLQIGASLRLSTPFVTGNF